MFEKCECGLSILIGVKKKKGGGPQMPSRMYFVHARGKVC